MIIDALLTLSDAQAITVDVASTNTIDLGLVGGVQIGDGEPLVAMFTIDVGADFTTTDETYSFQIIQSATANLATPDILAVRTITAANLKAGAIQSMFIPIGTPTKRYLGVFYDVGGTTPLLTVTCQIQPASMVQQRQTSYPGVF